MDGWSLVAYLFVECGADNNGSHKIEVLNIMEMLRHGRYDST